MKGLFFDIDGTLIDKHAGIREIPEGVLKELRRIQSMGHKVFIASGRPWQMLNCGFLDKGFDGYILANGGYIEVDGKSIHEEIMDYSILKEISTMLDSYNTQYMIQTAKEIYLDKSHTEVYEIFSNIGNGITFSREFDKDEVLKRTIKIEAMSKEIGAKIIEYLNSTNYPIRYDLNGTIDFFELFSSYTSKAEGIKRVCQYCGIDLKDTYAFGDGHNDMEMIELCHVGVAMGNACDALKQKADIVCGNVGENGLENILKELF